MIMYTNIKTILYASDLGGNTRPAFHLAIDLAEKYGAKIVFLHIIEPINNNAQIWITPDVWDKFYSQALTDAETRVNERIKNFYTEEMPKTTTVNTPKPVIVRGRVTESILQTADDENADLIIMGQHKRSVLGEMLVGSSADKVVHHSKRPVMVVPIS